jgi:hypothetical protein
MYINRGGIRLLPIEHRINLNPKKIRRIKLYKG